MINFRRHADDYVTSFLKLPHPHFPRMGTRPFRQRPRRDRDVWAFCPRRDRDRDVAALGIL